MISLKDSIQINRVQHLEQNFEVALECYVGAINAIEKHTLPITDELVQELRDSINGMRQTIATEPTPDVLRDSLQTLIRAIQDFADKGGAVLKKKDEDVREILSLLSNVAGAMSTSSDGRQGRLRGFVSTLEGITQLNNLGAIRTNLSAQVTEMKAYQEVMEKETRSHIDELRGELNEFRQRLSAAEILALTDPLTGLANRRAGERQLEDRIRCGRPFCVLIFDLDHFKHINDHWGHHWGDQVLKTFASRLARQVRSEDMVCRWGGDEFLVILGCDLRIATARAGQLAQGSSGDCHIAFGGQDLRIDVKPSVGVAQYQAGETSEQVFARADALLYGGKSTGPADLRPGNSVCRLQ